MKIFSYFITILVTFLAAGTSGAFWVDGSRTDPFSDETIFTVASLSKNGTDSGAIAIMCRSEQPRFVVGISVEGLTMLSTAEPSFRLRVDKGMIREPIVVVNAIGYWFGYTAERIVADIRQGNKIFLRGINDSSGSISDFTFEISNFNEVYEEVIGSQCK